jgi:D-lactate dehydrogenase (cytochrome)
MLIITDPQKIANDYLSYLVDESSIKNAPVHTLYFPENHDDVLSVVRDVRSSGEHLTISGGRTGIVGGAVAREVHSVVSLEKLKGDFVIGWDELYMQHFVRCQAGSCLSELALYLERGQYVYSENTRPRISSGRLFFPVNPTESTAEIGGAVATNASGSWSYYFGSVRKWVRRLKIVLADGSTLELRRGVSKKSEKFELPNGLTLLPVEAERPLTKQTLGYYLPKDGELIDLFIGSEGTLGIITEVDFFLIDEPRYSTTQLILFDNHAQLLSALCDIKHERALKTVALEFYDANALAILKDHPIAESFLARLTSQTQCALYVETFYEKESDLDAIYTFYDALLARYSLQSNASWFAEREKDIALMAELRHYLPEEINRRVAERKKQDPEIRKCATDMAVPCEALPLVLKEYEQNLRLSGLEYVIFGHIGDGHLHINSIPRSREECDTSQALYAKFADIVIEYKGALAAEHGIGRIKKEFLKKQFSPVVINQMKAIKETLDPHMLFNPGVLFDM